MRFDSSGFRALAAALFLLFGKPLAPAHAQIVEEQITVEAAMTLQILAFTEWPTEARRPDDRIVVGVFNNEEASAAFEALLNDPRFATRYELIRIAPDTSAETLDSLHAVFFASADATEIPRLLRRIDSRSIVLVGAYDGFLEEGGMVNFIRRQRKLGFIINNATSRSRGIEYRAKLLRLATEVVEK